MSPLLNKEQTADVWNKKGQKANIPAEKQIFHGTTTATLECSRRHKMFLKHPKCHNCSMLWSCNHMSRLGVSRLEDMEREGTLSTLLNSLFICQARRSLEGEHIMVLFCVNYFLISQNIENASVSLKWCGILCCDYYQTLFE